MEATLIIKSILSFADQKILKAGQIYYDKGRVKSVYYDEVTNEYSAIVRGTEYHSFYIVQIPNNNNYNVTHNYCDCLSDKQPCKHLVAVTYAIEEYKKKGEYKDPISPIVNAFYSFKHKLSFKIFNNH